MRRRSGVAAIALVACVAPPGFAASGAGPVRVHLGAGEVQANAPLFGAPSLSADGSKVAFDSTASNLVSGDANGHGDVFVYGRADRSVRRVSVAGDGAEGDGGSGLATISADGSRVAFVSAAANLIAGDRNGYVDAFVVDVPGGAVRPIGSPAGGQAQGDVDGATLSGDGTTAALVTAWPLTAEDADFSFDVYTVDPKTSQIRLVSSGQAGSGVVQPRAAYGPVLSADGRWIAYTSGEGDPTPGGPPAGSQVYLRDLAAGDLRLISTPAAGQSDDTAHGAAISADGMHVGFASTAQNLVAFDNNHASDAFVLDVGGRRYPAGGPTRMPRDVFAPDTVIVDGPPTEPTPGPARFAFRADEAGSTFECRLDADPETVGEDEGWTACPAAHSVAAAPGEHLLEVRAADAAGNVDASPAQRVFTLPPAQY